MRHEWLAGACALLLCATVPSATLAQTGTDAATAAAGRRTVALDAGWRFDRSDVYDALRPDYDDAKWGEVTLPHTFNGADGDDGGGYYRGPGWYRRSVDIVQPTDGRRRFLQFDGAALAADLWVNGRHVGRHAGGHAAFRFDITDMLVPGRNVVAVRVNNTQRPEITPLGGDFTVFGGLYRRVFLIESADAHVDLLDSGGPGVAVVQGAITPAAARIEVKVRAANDGAIRRKLGVRASVIDATGRTVATATRNVDVAPRSVTPTSVPIVVPDPHRWNGRKDPYLYRVATEIVAGNGAVVDSVEVPLGLRTVAFDGDKGFLLNGAPYPLHGVNLFSPGRPGRGLAVTDAEVDADFDTLVDLGVTGLRLVHFQHPSASYDAADRLGLPVWTEIGINSRVDPGKPFADNVTQQMRELIRQNINHPSVILWGIGNEVYSEGPEVPALLKVAQATAKAEDRSRPTVYAHCCQGDDVAKARVSDLTGYNRYFGWYKDQSGTTMASWADAFRAAHPRTPYAVSEYGAGASIRHQQQAPPPPITDGGWHPEQVQALYHETNWRALRDRPGLFGTFVWVGFDLASDGRAEGDRDGINDKGLVTYDRAVRKDAFYWYQANWSDRPVLHITSRRHIERSDPVTEVKVYGNGGPVTLSVNGVAIGTRPLDDHIARWTGVQLRPGANRVEVKATYGSNVISDAVTWRYTPLPAVVGSDYPVVPPKP
ncbi:MAG TPA: glycoside hydrolase family 2 TIM barrel-domain containing protein [Sphingomonas sp.]|jgi:beta-galactosidase